MKRYPDTTQCQLGPVRASYANVFKARQGRKKPDGSFDKAKYEITCLIPKEPHKYLPKPEEEISGLKELILEAKAEGFGSKEVKGFKQPLKDGDKIEEGESVGPYPGYWYIKASTAAAWPDGEPKNLMVIDGRGVPVGGGWGSGDWCKVKINIKSYANESKGVTAFLDGVQWLYKDEPMGGGGGTQANEFDTVADADYGGSEPVQREESRHAGEEEKDIFADE